MSETRKTPAGYYDTRPRCDTTGKVIFYREERAWESAYRIMSRSDETWNAYHCEACGYYHVGHKKGKTNDTTHV